MRNIHTLGISLLIAGFALSGPPTACGKNSTTAVKNEFNFLIQILDGAGNAIDKGSVEVSSTANNNTSTSSGPDVCENGNNHCSQKVTQGATLQLKAVPPADVSSDLPDMRHDLAHWGKHCVEGNGLTTVIQSPDDPNEISVIIDQSGSLECEAYFEIVESIDLLLEYEDYPRAFDPGDTVRVTATIEGNAAAPFDVSFAGTDDVEPAEVKDLVRYANYTPDINTTISVSVRSDSGLGKTATLDIPVNLVPSPSLDVTGPVSPGTQVTASVTLTGHDGDASTDSVTFKDGLGNADTIEEPVSGRTFEMTYTVGDDDLDVTFVAKSGDKELPEATVGTIVVDPNVFGIDVLERPQGDQTHGDVVSIRFVPFGGQAPYNNTPTFTPDIATLGGSLEGPNASDEYTLSFPADHDETIQISMEDAGGAVANRNVDVFVTLDMIVELNPTTAVQPGGDISVIAEPVGGTGNYKNVTFDGFTGAKDLPEVGKWEYTFTNVAQSRSVSVVVTDSDAVSFPQEVNLEVVQGGTLNVSLEMVSPVTQDVQKLIDESVEIRAIATGGDSNFTYTWNLIANPSGGSLSINQNNDRMQVNIQESTPSGTYTFECEVYDGMSPRSEGSATIDVVVWGTSGASTYSLVTNPPTMPVAPLTNVTMTVTGVTGNECLRWFRRDVNGAAVDNPWVEIQSARGLDNMAMTVTHSNDEYQVRVYDAATCSIPAGTPPNAIVTNTVHLEHNGTNPGYSIDWSWNSAASGNGDYPPFPQRQVVTVVVEDGSGPLSITPPSQLTLTAKATGYEIARADDSNTVTYDFRDGPGGSISHPYPRGAVYPHFEPMGGRYGCETGFEKYKLDVVATFVMGSDFVNQDVVQIHQCRSECGNGVVESFNQPTGYVYEECDDGNQIDNDGCTACIWD